MPNPPVGGLGLRRVIRIQLFNFRDVIGLWTFLTLRDVELHCVAFLQGLEPLALDGGVVNEDVRPPILADEAVTLGVIEPFHFSLKSCHLRSSLTCFRDCRAPEGQKSKKPRIRTDPRPPRYVPRTVANTQQAPG